MAFLRTASYIGGMRADPYRVPRVGDRGMRNACTHFRRKSVVQVKSLSTESLN